MPCTIFLCGCTLKNRCVLTYLRPCGSFNMILTITGVCNNSLNPTIPYSAKVSGAKLLDTMEPALDAKVKPPSGGLTSGTPR